MTNDGVKNWLGNYLYYHPKDMRTNLVDCVN